MTGVTDGVVQTLRGLVATHGIDRVTTDASWVRNILADLSPETRAFNRVLMVAVQEGIPADLRRAATGGSVALAIARGVDLLVGDYSIERGAATDAVNAWARVVGLPSMVSPAPEALPVPAPAPSAVTDTTKRFDHKGRQPSTRNGRKASKCDAGAAPFFSSRAYLAGKAGYDPRRKTFTSPGPLDYSQWEANAKAAHAGGKGWLHGYTDPSGRFMARSAEYHKVMGTDAKKGTMLALSVKNPFSIDQKSGQANRTVMIGINMPNGKVQHLMWHQNPGESTGRYIPIHGIDHNGFGVQHEDNYIKGKYGNKALQHMCEYAALYFPGTNFTQEDEDARKANRFASIEQVNMASNRDYLPQLVSRDQQEGLFKQINESSASNTLTFNVDEKISEAQGIDHATGQRLSGRQTSRKTRLAAATKLNQNMNHNIRAGFQDAFTRHQAAIRTGQMSPFAAWQHTGSNVVYSSHDLAAGIRLDLHNDEAHI